MRQHKPNTSQKIRINDHLNHQDVPWLRNRRDFGADPAAESRSLRPDRLRFTAHRPTHTTQTTHTPTRPTSELTRDRKSGCPLVCLFLWLSPCVVWTFAWLCGSPHRSMTPCGQWIRRKRPRYRCGVCHAMAGVKPVPPLHPLSWTDWNTDSTTRTQPIRIGCKPQPSFV